MVAECSSGKMLWWLNVVAADRMIIAHGAGREGALGRELRSSKPRKMNLDRVEEGVG